MASVSGNPLLFSRAVALDGKLHQEWKIESIQHYGFCRDIRFLPVTLSEFGQVALEQPIVFVEDGELIVPVAVLGLDDSNNLFVDESGGWSGRYLPAYTRMYPFILAPRDDKKGYVVCIDADYPGFSQTSGTALFDGDGAQTKFTQQAIAFASEYQRQREQALVFTALLKEYDLLEPASVSVHLGEENKLSVGGFLSVNRKKLAALTDQQVTNLFSLSQLEPIYLHLASLANFDRLSQRLVSVKSTQQQVA